jgi:hypothetical protein
MHMTDEKPADLAPLSELARKYGIPYPTLRYWQKQGKLGEWASEYGGIMASDAEIRAKIEPRRVERKGESGGQQP